ncbi:MAG TPA: flavodoxin [Bacteroides sp.]|nr:flavodoxin [Bacteroides sp.]
MKETGIFYGSSSGNTETVAMKIFEWIGKDKSSVKDVADSRAGDLLYFDLLILGIPTWGIGEMQDDWAVFLAGLEDMDLTGKKVAIFGLGDQESYPDTFSDALGTLYDSLSETGCEIIGSWSTLGYEFVESGALRDGMFAGLVLDEENQQQLTDLRINDWLKTIIPNGKSEGQPSHI